MKPQELLKINYESGTAEFTTTDEFDELEWQEMLEFKKRNEAETKKTCLQLQNLFHMAMLTGFLHLLKTKEKMMDYLNTRGDKEWTSDYIWTLADMNKINWVKGYDDPDRKPLYELYELFRLTNTSMLFFGDSMMKQIFHAHSCELEREGLMEASSMVENVYVNEISNSNLLPPIQVNYLKPSSSLIVTYIYFCRCRFSL